MQFSTVFVFALAGFAAAEGGEAHAKGNSTGGTSVKSQCKQVQKLTKLTELAANQTKLADATNNNQTLMAEITAKAQQAQTQLATIQSNATLMGECNAIFATKSSLNNCEKMFEIEQAQKIAANETLLAEITKNNQTKADAFKAKVSAKAAELATLSSNTTLTAFCAVQKDKAMCVNLAKLTKEQALAANTTALSAKMSADKIAQFQAKVAERAAKMAPLMNNATLMAECQTFGVAVAATAGTGTGTGTTTSGAATASSGSKKSAANNVNVGAGHVVALVAALGCALAIL